MLRLDDPAAGRCFLVFTDRDPAARDIEDRPLPGCRPLALGSAPLIQALAAGGPHVALDISPNPHHTWRLVPVRAFLARLPTP